MRAGKLRWRIELHSDGTPAADSLGQMQPADTLLGTYWGAISTLGGAERVNAEQIKGEVTHRVTLRWPGASTTIVPKMRLVFKTRTFNIVWIDNVDERNRQLDVYCQEVITPP